MKHIVVHGPAGCGKTRNRMEIAKHFDADVVIDDWRGNILFQPNVKGPFTDGKVVKSPWRETPCRTVLYLYTTPDNSCLPFPDRPQGDFITFECFVDVPFVRKESDDMRVVIPDDASIFQSSRTEADNPNREEPSQRSDEDLMRTIIDAYDELRDRGYDVYIDQYQTGPLTFEATHVTLTRTLKGEPK